MVDPSYEWRLGLHAMDLNAAGHDTTAGLPWFDVMSAAYGAVNDNSTNDRAAINAAIAALNSAGRGVLYFPGGTGYYVSGGGLTAITVPCLILGDGAGGSSPANSATYIRSDHATADLFTLSAGGIKMANLTLRNTNGSESAGAAVTTTTGAGMLNHYENVWVYGFYDGMDLLYGYEWSMVDCHINDPVRYGLNISNIDSPDGGDWSMANVWLGAQTRNSTSAIHQVSGGGGKITNLKINGGTFKFTTGIEIAIPTAIATSLFTLASASIENVSGDAILVTTTGTAQFGLITLTGLEVGLYSNNSGRAVKLTAASTGGIGSSGGIGVVSIDGGVFRTDGTARAAVELTKTDSVVLGDYALLGFNARYTSSADTNTTDAGSGGSVTSVALTVPAEFSVSGSPVTTSGTLAVTKANESANTVWAGPTSGGAAAPIFRALVAADIPAGVGTTDHEHVENVVFSGDGSTTVWTLPAGAVDATSIDVYVAGDRSIAWVLSGSIFDTLTFDAAPASGTNNIVIDIVAAVA